ncbi:hypothetical protein DEO72_LG3g2379 [Vigna unguiculata]|uniref:Uncharacterized protein n=1 Tax=Vigna unguiculata TaxID=3917 RepID=A0A4D6LGR6_VIGUN|nr:hypothetical protein DEO72_LG3g2379 [Vigna unguiculata]
MEVLERVVSSGEVDSARRELCGQWPLEQVTLGSEDDPAKQYLQSQKPLVVLCLAAYGFH